MPKEERCFSMGKQKLSGPVAVDEELCGSRKKFSAGKGGAERQTRLHMACGWAELGKVASGSAAQGLWSGDKKERFQVMEKSEADSLKEKQLGKSGEEKHPATKRRNTQVWG